MPTTLFPPGPKGHWLSGNLPEYRRGRLECLTGWSREFGDVVGLRFAHHRILLISDPRLIEEVLVTQSKHFRKHFALRINPMVLGKGLLTSEGDFWLRQRRLVQPAFNRQHLAEYSRIMSDVVQRMLAGWREGALCNAAGEMMRLTLDIAARTMFSSEAAAEAEQVAQALDVLQRNFLARFQGLLLLPLWLPTPSHLRLKRAVRLLDDIIYRFIRQRRQEGSQRGDVLTLLLNARDEDDGSRMSDQQVRDEAMTLFLAGHETTALALSWAWYLLASHPEAEERLAREVHEVCGNRLPSIDDIGRLRFTEMVVQETMRLYPPAYCIGREAIADCTLGGYVVKRGMTVLMSQWVVQRDPRHFAEPERFRPERWSEPAIKNLPKFAYFPFGGGPRLCIGNTFAMTEMVLVLASIAQKFHFTLQPGAVVKPWPTFTLHPAPGIPAILRRR